MISFIPGRVYTVRSTCDHECIFRFTVLNRTAKFLSIEDTFGKVKRVGVSIDFDGTSEICHPLGRYSMSPILKADRPEV